MCGSSVHETVKSASHRDSGVAREALEVRRTFQGGLPEAHRKKKVLQLPTAGCSTTLRKCKSPILQFSSKGTPS